MVTNIGYKMKSLLDADRTSQRPVGVTRSPRYKEQCSKNIFHTYFGLFMGFSGRGIGIV